MAIHPRIPNKPPTPAQQAQAATKLIVKMTLPSPKTALITGIPGQDGALIPAPGNHVAKIIAKPLFPVLISVQNLNKKCHKTLR